MLVELFDRLDEFARVEQFGLVYHVRNDQRGDTFAVADDRVGSLGRQVVDQVHTFEDISQFIQQAHDLFLHFDALHLIGDNTLNHIQVTCYDFRKLSFVSDIPFGSHDGSCQQLVGYAAQGRYDNDYRLFNSLYYLLNKILFTEPTDVPPNFNTFIGMYYFN